MKILMVLGVADRTEAQLFRSLHDRGIELGVVCEPGAAIGAEFKGLDVPVFELEFRNRLDFRAIRRLRSILSDGDYDIAHAFTNRGLSCLLLARRGMRVKVVAYRGTMGHVSRWDPGSHLTYLNRRLDHIICVSNAVRAYLVECGVPASRLTTVYKGHEPGWYTDVLPADLSELELPEDNVAVVFCGKMRRVKGVDVLIDAMHLLADRSSIHLLLVGEVADENLYGRANAGRASNRIHFLGYRSDAVAVTARADIFVMPSISREGLPRALLEAMLLRVAPIVSRIGGMPELVKDGVTGLVVPPADAQALADAIERLATDADLRKRLGESAHAGISEGFNMGVTVGATVNVYDSLL